jgi:acetyl esterase/lipase
VNGTSQTSLLDIHPDFRAIRAFETPLTPVPLAISDAVIRLMNFAKCARLGGVVARRVITGSEGHTIGLLVVRPAGLPVPSPALVYCHGGAFVYRHSPMHIDNVVRYAREAGCCVLVVDYRLAPRHRFPCGFDDCYDALAWVYRSAESLGVDPQRIAIGGDSAGGALAASAAQKATHSGGIPLCGQLLIYPTTECAADTGSLRAFADVPPFKKLSAPALWRAYLGHSPERGVTQYAAPLRGTLSGLPRAYVETVEFDPLRDEGILYVQALQRSGVEVTHDDVKRAVHGFDLLAVKSPISQRALERRVQFLREVFRVR